MLEIHPFMVLNLICFHVRLVCERSRAYLRSCPWAQPYWSEHFSVGSVFVEFAKDIRTFHLIILDDLENIIRWFVYFNTISCVWLWRYKSRRTSSVSWFVRHLFVKYSHCAECESVFVQSDWLRSKNHSFIVRLSWTLFLAFIFGGETMVLQLLMLLLSFCWCFGLFEIIKSLRVSLSE